MSDDPANPEFKPQYTVKTVKHCDASIMILLILRVGPIYRIPGIMDQFEYIKEVILLYAEEEIPWTLVFQ